jgi:hypothetical protein
MRPGMQCLLEILRGQIGERAIDEAEWDDTLALAEEEHVVAWAVAGARARNVALTPAIANRLVQIERDAAIAAFYWTSELKGLLRAFDQAGIAVVPLKGPFLAERLYGSAALRVNRDLDLVVSIADLARAEAVLGAEGFVAGAADDYHRPWHRQSTTVELHHDVENPLAFDFHVESALRRAHAATFHGEPCRQLAAEDELLFLCLHAARHRYERLSLMVDLQLAFEKLPATTREWKPRPEVAGLDCLLALGVAMVRRMQPEAGVAAAVTVSSRQAEHLEQVAERLWQRLLTQSCKPLDWRAAHAFFLEIELPGWPRLSRRVRHLWILQGRVIDVDYAFAARFGLKRGWQVRVLRSLRLALAAMRRLSSQAGNKS